MMTCYVVFSDPGHVFESIHRTVDGAVAMAASIGAARMPDGSDITIDAVADFLRLAASIAFACHVEEGIATAHIERHAILV